MVDRDKIQGTFGKIDSAVKSTAMGLFSLSTASSAAFYDGVSLQHYASMAAQLATSAALFYETWHQMARDEFDGRGFRIALYTASLSGGLNATQALIERDELLPYISLWGVIKPTKVGLIYLMMGQPQPKKPFPKLGQICKNVTSTMSRAMNPTPTPTKADNVEIPPQYLAEVGIPA